MQMRLNILLHFLKEVLHEVVTNLRKEQNYQMQPFSHSP